MRSSLSLAGRRAGVLTAAALVSLATAGCGPAGLQIGAAGATGQPKATAAVVTEHPLPAGGPAAAPSGTIPDPTPAPVQPTLPPQPQQQGGSGESSEVEGEDSAGSTVADVPAEIRSAPPQAAAEPEAGKHGRSAAAPAAAAAPVAAAAVDDTATRGSGGTFTDQARRSFTASGQSGNYLLYAGGIDPAKPVGLVVYVDGTGEYGVDNPGTAYALGGSAGLVATSRARNMLTLAVESPNQSCECWHTGDTGAYADFLAALIEEQLAAYPVSEVWLAGFSSGAQEITRFLVPRHPELMRLGGGWVVFGGGGPPADKGSAVTAARMAGVRGHWFTGTADTSVPLTASWGAQAGERFYAGRGVVTSTEYPAGVGHGLDGRLGRTLGRLIDAA